MLNYRRMSLLKRLLQSNSNSNSGSNSGEYVSVDILAEELGASEKTIRTDLKALDSWLVQYPDLHVVRKPGLGVYLEATVATREALSERLKLNGKKSFESVSGETLRKQVLLELLLQRDPVITTQELAEKLYVSKPVIRHELKEIDNWLKDFHLKLIKKPKVGLQIEGKENDCRAALAELVHQGDSDQSDSEFQSHRSRVASPAVTNSVATIASVSSQGVADRCGRIMNARDMSLLEGWIRELQESVEVDFTDSAVENLVIHIAIALRRMKDKKFVPVSNEEIRIIQEKLEFKWAMKIADRVKETFGMTLPVGEVAYIGFHFMGSKRQSLMENDSEAFTFSIQLVRGVERLIRQPLSKDRELITGIAIHLHSALNRLRYGLRVKNPLLSQIKEMYRYPFEALLLVVPRIADPIGLVFPEDEIGYLTLHIQAALERLHRDKEKPIRALVVCSAGTGTSRLLSSRLTRIFPDIHVVHVTSMFRLNEGIREYNPDVIISTVPLVHSTIPVVTVSALFSESDRLKVEALLAGLAHAGKQYSTIGSMVVPDLVFIDLALSDRFRVIDFLTEKLTELGYTDSGYGESTKDREQISSTAIGGGVAIPHGQSQYIRKPCIAIARLKQPIDWGSEKVRLVFMLAITFDNRNQTEQLFREMADLVDDENVLKALGTMTTASELISCLEGFFQ